jgi:hypothetical protein
MLAEKIYCWKELSSDWWNLKFWETTVFVCELVQAATVLSFDWVGHYVKSTSSIISFLIFEQLSVQINIVVQLETIQSCDLWLQVVSGFSSIFFEWVEDRWLREVLQIDCGQLFPVLLRSTSLSTLTWLNLNKSSETRDLFIAEDEVVLQFLKVFCLLRA